MAYLDVTHIGICVQASLREAEAFYCQLFDLHVSWREPVPDDAPFDLSWEELDRAGCQPTIVLLHSDAFRLAITERPDEQSDPGPITHIGLQASVDQLRAVRARALGAGYAVLGDRPDELFDFVDPFGVEWELDTRSFSNPRAIVEAKRQRERQAVRLPKDTSD
jgi:catechol 2,3-dioxygenase-like lactoylglutathione lyase family enzyme